MEKLINILIIILVISAIILLGVIVYRYSQYQKNSQEAVAVAEKIEEEFEQTLETNNKVEMEYKG